MINFEVYRERDSELQKATGVQCGLVVRGSHGGKCGTKNAKSYKH